ncbi:cysteine/Histidine-rich C1 domain family protein [Striga asiatica]|uniref:Cysteine/Histidine-rich C1 domain family protein n=1 Tax=Striga asiatica TaxID=4170 RepID=A0A5A7PKI2_STRAF|nr:cysteine/Histidine-rich C1 domain family protein [Striga asiatica]
MAQKTIDYTYNKQHSFREPEPENDHDPDFVADWACDTCTLPIFSTPGNRFMHDECANLPATLAPLLHPRSIQSGEWHYRCHLCQQSLHFNCVPSVDRLSKIKFGFTVRVQGHPCPVACVRALSVYCYMCGHCGKTIKEHNDEIAFECPKCYFRIHKDCCAKTLLSDKDDVTDCSDEDARWRQYGKGVVMKLWACGEVAGVQIRFRSIRRTAIATKPGIRPSATPSRRQIHSETGIECERLLPNEVEHLQAAILQESSHELGELSAYGNIYPNLALPSVHACQSYHQIHIQVVPARVNGIQLLSSNNKNQGTKL